MKNKLTRRNKPLTRKLTHRLTEGDFILIDLDAKRRKQTISEWCRDAYESRLRRK